jgi:hypothetical protein
LGSPVKLPVNWDLGPHHQAQAIDSDPRYIALLKKMGLPQ